MGSKYETRLALSSSVILPLEPNRLNVESCTILAGRYSAPDQIGILAQTELVRSGGQVVASPRLPSAYPLVASFLSRLDRFVPILLGSIGAIISTLQYRMRSSEFAAYRFSGTRKGALFQMLMIEQLICAGAFATSGIFALYLFRTRLEFPEILGAWMMVAAGAWVAVFAMTAPWLILRNPMRLAKDR